MIRLETLACIGHVTNKKTQTSNLHPKAKHKKHTVLHTKFQELVEFCREFPTLHGSTELQRHVRTSGQAPWHRKCFRLFGPFHRTGSCKILFSSSPRYHLRKFLYSLNASLYIYHILCYLCFMFRFFLSPLGLHHGKWTFCTAAEIPHVLKKIEN